MSPAVFSPSILTDSHVHVVISTNGETEPTPSPIANAKHGISLTPTVPPRPVETNTLLVAADIKDFPLDDRTTNVGSGDTRTVLITTGCVGGIAVLVLFIFWVAIHLAARRKRYLVPVPSAWRPETLTKYPA